MTPIISVCLCCYNDAPYLEWFFKSIRDTMQGGVPYEVCIVDNASTDDTMKVIAKWSKLIPNIVWTTQDKNEGVIAVNRAVQLSVGKYIVNCNSDMIFLPGWDITMFHHLRKLEAHNNGLASVSATLIEPVSGNQEYVYAPLGTSPDTVDYEKLMKFNNMTKRLMPDTIQFSHPIMMSRETWDKVGGISEGYPFPGMCTDVDLGFKLLSSGAKCVMIGSAFVYHFSSATLKRMRSDGIETPPGTKEFIEKWGAHPDDMYKKYNVRTKVGIHQC